MTLPGAIWHLGGRHLAAFHMLAFWFAGPSVAAAFGVDLSFALRFSWMGAVPFAIYMYQTTAASQLLGILPMTRRDIWQLTWIVGALIPALVQCVVATAIWAMAFVLLGAEAHGRLVGIDTPLLGAVYTLGFLTLVLVATASLRRQRGFASTLSLVALGAFAWFTDALPARLSDFSAASALAFCAAATLVVILIRRPGALAAPVPARLPSYRLTFDLPGLGVLDRLTGVKRILLVHTLFGVLCFGGGFSVALLLDVWLDGRPLVESIADELRAFHGERVWVMRPGDSLFFTPMWIIGFANIWTPMAHQLRVLPLTARAANAIFLASPIAMWLVLWVMYLITYALIVGGPIMPRLDLFLALSGTSTLANVISLRWKNLLYGMFGVVFVYGFWIVASIVALILNVTDAFVPLTIIGATFYGAAIALNHHTLVHATSASAAYQRQPTFFDTPARS